MSVRWLVRSHVRLSRTVPALRQTPRVQYVAACLEQAVRRSDSVLKIKHRKAEKRYRYCYCVVTSWPVMSGPNIVPSFTEGGDSEGSISLRSTDAAVLFAVAVPFFFVSRSLARGSIRLYLFGSSTPSLRSMSWQSWYSCVTYRLLNKLTVVEVFSFFVVIIGIVVYLSNTFISAMRSLVSVILYGALLIAVALPGARAGPSNLCDLRADPDGVQCECNEHRVVCEVTSPNATFTSYRSQLQQEALKKRRAAETVSLSNVIII